MPPDQGSAAEGVIQGPPPKPWVRRLVENQNVTVDERQLGWWTFHLEEFLRYCRRRGDRVEARILARGFFDELRLSQPPVASLRVEQTKQALTVFVRGIENWHWEQTETSGWWPRFRVKAIEAPCPAGAAETPAMRLPAPPADRSEWERATRAALRVRHYAIRTEETYVHWNRQFLAFHAAVPLSELGALHVRRFLEHLAIGRSVTAGTQNQALSALLFFFRYVLGREVGDLTDTVRAKRGRKLPIVLGREEVRRLLQAADGTTGLMLHLLYGGGLRMMECLRLRVKDVDLERDLITVRSGKGDKDRTVPLPRRLHDDLVAHLDRLRALHAADRQAQLPAVWLPDALSVKYPRAGEEFAWQWFFPGKHPGLDPRSGLRRRHHLHDNTLHLAMKAAALPGDNQKSTRRQSETGSEDWCN